MRDRSSHAILSLFGIVAFNGILLLLPGAAHGASAAPPSDGAGLTPHLVADIAASLGCAMVETVAVAQDPPEGQDGSECTNQDGSGRGCTPSENLKQCAADISDAYEQCMGDARNFLDKISCGLGLGIDGVGCVAEGVVETILPIKKVVG